MKKFIRSSNDLLLSILMGAVAAFLLTNQKIIIGVENGLGGMWAQASTYIHLLAGILLAMAILQLIYAIDFKGAAEHKKLHIPVSKEIVITAAALVLYALLLPVLTFFPCTLALNIVLCATFAPKGTDPAILSYISEKMGEVCQNEDFVKAMSNLGFTVDYVDGAAAKERTIKWAEELKPVFEEMAKIAG